MSTPGRPNFWGLIQSSDITWDLAKATGQNTTLDTGLSEIGFNMVSVVAPLGCERGAFGSEVSVDDPASFRDRMLSMSGRQP